MIKKLITRERLWAALFGVAIATSIWQVTLDNPSVLIFAAAAVAIVWSLVSLEHITHVRESRAERVEDITAQQMEHELHVADLVNASRAIVDSYSSDQKVVTQSQFVVLATAIKAVTGEWQNDIIARVRSGE